MCRKFILFCALVLALFISQPSWANIVYDDFNTPHDYLNNGVGGTLWDGFVGAGTGETADAINADINEPNSLYLASTNGAWEPPFETNLLGPFLYKNVKSDNWIMVTRVSAYPEGVFWNLFGIMARASIDPDEAGTGEDSEQLGHFEVTHAANIQAMDDGVQVYDLSVGMLASYLRLRQVTEINELGDVNTVFYHEISFDGKDWTLHPGSPRLRNDLTGLTLQLGMQHAAYTAYGWGAYGETLILYRGEGQAWYQSPEYNAASLDLKPTLTWLPGPYVKSSQGHEVYISDDYSKVDGRDVSVKTVTDANSHPVTSSLDLDTVYYWCVDEVNDACAPYEWEGDIWSFTTNNGKPFDPIPYDGQGGIPPLTERLRWTQNKYAVTQDLYLGTDEATVAAMTTPTVADITNDVNYIVLANEGIELLPAVTYYWRVDSDCGGLGTAKGDVWSFLTAYPFKICDDFETNHDYFSGVEGTIWDGVLGIDYCYIMSTVDLNDGQLYIQSTGAFWDFRSGVMLYMDVPGNFAARIHLTDFQGLFVDRGSAVATNNAGIMARVSDVDLAGEGEDWLSNDFFPGWGVGNLVRECNDGTRSERGIEGNGWNADRWLQIERRGNDFYFSHGQDGDTYTESPASPITRPDLEGLSLQVGPAHATFGNNTAFVEYDDFCLERNAVEKAYAPNPPGGGMLDVMVGILKWTKGDFAISHHVYFSSDFNDVNERKPAADRGTSYVVDEGGGRFSYDAGFYETLAMGQDYYWCIDEINDPCLWPGDVWRFTIQDYSPIDNFELYNGTGKSAYLNPPAGSLRKVWVCGNSKWSLYLGSPATSGSLVQLNTDTADGNSLYPHYVPDDEDIAQSGAQSMKFYYDNDGTCTYEVDLYGGYPPDVYTYTPTPNPYLSEVYAAIDNAAAEYNRVGLGMKRDWSSYKVLKLSFYGDPNNDAEPMYAGLEDEDGTLVAVQYAGDLNDLKEPWWHDWYVALSDFSDSGVVLSEVVKIYIGFGIKAAQQSGGDGVVFFDDILIYAEPQCVPGSVIGDLDDDCVINNSDLEIFTLSFPGETPILPTPIIELDADNLSEDPGEDVTSWYNTGSKHGYFTDVNSADSNNPVVAVVLGKKCVTFDANDMLIWDQNAPATLTSDRNEPNDYTVIYEAYNDEIADQEWILTWARRFSASGAEYERRHAGFGYGTNTSYGAICHWDAPGDMPFGLGVPPAGRWHVIAATYDGTTNAVIVDGLVHGLEDKDLRVVQNDAVTVGAGYLDDPNEGWIQGPGGRTYTPELAYRFTGSIASIKVYADAIPPGDLAIVTASMAGLPKAVADIKQDSKIDFKDLAVMGNKWLQSEFIGD